jgi:hypothetical protein
VAGKSYHPILIMAILTTCCMGLIELRTIHDSQ